MNQGLGFFKTQLDGGDMVVGQQGYMWDCQIATGSTHVTSRFYFSLPSISSN